MKILLRSPKDKQWHLVESAAYSNEKELQKLLADSPSLISLDEIRPDAGPLVLAVREFPLPVGSLDLLAFTPSGEIAVIECKLAKNSEVKRKVIGQLLEYAAYLWEMSYEDLDTAVRLRQGASLAELMNETVRSPNWDEESFRSGVQAALASGNFILVIVVDEINDELTRIVRYVNASGSPSFAFAALEMRRFHGEGAEMLVPRVFGPARITKTEGSSVSTKVWDEASFFAALIDRHGESFAAPAKRILDWAQSKTRVWWGRGRRSGSFVPCFTYQETEHQLFAVWTYGTVEIYFQWYCYKPPFDDEARRLELLDKLNQIPGVKIPKDSIARRPNIPLSALDQDGGVEKFLAVFDWMMAEISS